MLFVTFHGGHPGKHPLRNNIRAYDKNGKELTRAVLEEVNGVSLDELRSMRRVGKLLYVAVANKQLNSVLCYRGSGTTYRFISRFVSPETCRAIVHPFDFAFDGNGFCYVSSQDTNLVTRLTVSADGKTGAPLGLAPALSAQGALLPGTFVASSVGSLCNLSTTPVKAPLGLEYSAEGQKKHSVRGVLWINKALYVVDQPAGRVKVYNREGELLGQSNQIESPVHLTAHNDRLFVSGGNEVFSAKLSQRAGNFRLSPVRRLRIKNGGGMAFSKKGNLYIASRTENRIFKFDPDFRPMDFACELPDNPEFLLYV